MSRLSGQVIDITSVFGRVTSALRRELKVSQAVFADELKMDRSLLARVESGRNVATINDIVRLEQRFRKTELLEEHGDLYSLTLKVVSVLDRRGARVALGKIRLKEGEEVMDTAVVDRITLRVVDRFFEDPDEDD